MEILSYKQAERSYFLIGSQGSVELCLSQVNATAWVKCLALYPALHVWLVFTSVSVFSQREEICL